VQGKIVYAIVEAFILESKTGSEGAKSSRFASLKNGHFRPTTTGFKKQLQMVIFDVSNY
jgi:hypothetical protein